MKKSMRLIIVLVVLVAVVAVVLPHSSLAANLDCNNGGVKVSTALGADGNCVGNDKQNPIFALIGKIIQLASGVFGLIMVLMIVIAGMEYVLAGGSPEKAKGARNRLESAATGLVLFILMFGILQLLLPPDARVFGS